MAEQAAVADGEIDASMQRGGAALSYVAGAAAAVLLAAVLWWINAPWAFPLDDAYITMHNAAAFAAGRDVNYGGSPLLGASSLAHLLAVALAQQVAPPVIGQFVVTTLGVVAYVLGLIALGRQSRLGPRESAGLIFLGLFAGWSCFDLFNGLETGWAMALVAWAIVLASGAPSRLLMALCGLLPFVRPELGLLSVALFGRQAHRRWPDARASAADMIVAGMVALPFLALDYAALGTVLPNTIAAKRAYFIDRSDLTANAGFVIWAVLVNFSYGLFGLLRAKKTSLWLALCLFAASFIGVYTLILPAALTWTGCRYVIVLAPVALWALAQMRSRRPELFWPMVCMGIAFTAVVASGQAQGFVIGGRQERDGLAAAQWIASNVRPGEPVLIHDAGAITIGNHQQMVDLVGLKTPWATALHKTISRDGYAARSYAIALIAQRSGARFAVVLHDQDGSWSAIRCDLARYGLRPQLVRLRTTTYGYDIYRISAPDRPLKARPTSCSTPDAPASRKD
jgi:hypothetical protein